MIGIQIDMKRIPRQLTEEGVRDFQRRMMRKYNEVLRELKADLIEATPVVPDGEKTAEQWFIKPIYPVAGGFAGGVFNPTIAAAVLDTGVKKGVYTEDNRPPLGKLVRWVSSRFGHRGPVAFAVARTIQRNMIAEGIEKKQTFTNILKMYRSRLRFSINTAIQEWWRA